MEAEFSKKCEYCSTPFETSNSRKKHCSNTCRTYASLERKGKLNSTQKAIRTGKLKKNRAINQSNEKTLLLKIGEEFLKGEFLECDNLDDEYYSVENVFVTDKETYILSSSNRELIDRFKERFEGSNIFGGVSKTVIETVYESINTIAYNLGLEEPSDLLAIINNMHLSPEQREYYQKRYDELVKYLKAIQLDTKSNERRKVKTFRTVLSLDKVLEVAKIPIEQIY